jgi:CHAT domain-containing protein
LLAVRLRQIEDQLQKLARDKGPAFEEQRERLLAEQLRAQDALAELDRALEKKHGPVAGQVLPLAALQKALPADGAYLGWLDVGGEHWAVLLRAGGAPVWVRLPGSGAKDAWTKADEALPATLHKALRTGVGDWRPLAARLRGQRLAPLGEHLKGVRHLVVLPSAVMDGTPVEVIAEGMTVSYASSASLFAHQKGLARSKSAGLVALGDPIFRAANQPELPLPPGGVLLRAVLPRSPAALSGLRSGDVLLKYGEAALTEQADLQRAIAASEELTPVRVWRLEGAKAKELTLRVPAGRLGVVAASDPAPKALAAQRKADALLAARNRDWQRLPGTRYEVSALAKLFAKDRPTVLLDSDASAARLTELAASGTLGKARYVHLATHGEARWDRPLASRLVLAQDRLGAEQRGELLAEQVLADWELSAELVTLSACQSGLGKHEKGEGFIGFAQALQLAGARSVCLSLWSVNDLSTALLMERLYQNLLGKRAGLKAPLGKAAALAEAKQWLRTLSRPEALKRAEAIGAGLERGPGARELPRLGVPAGPAEEPPYAHPYFWAGFILVGDPD